MLARGMVNQGGIPARQSGPGDILASGRVITTVNADSNQTLPAAGIAGGVINRTGMTAGRTDTTPTAHDTLVALAGNDYAANVLPGTVFDLVYRQAAAFATTWAHGRGWIAGTGTLNVTASRIRKFMCTILNSTPEVIRNATTTNASASVTLTDPQPAGTITPGMVVSGTGITAGTKVAGVHYGSTANRNNVDKIVSITLDQNATATGAADLTFSPCIEISSVEGETTL